MNIKARINARKIVFSYFFQKYFTESLLIKDVVFDEIVKSEIFINFNFLSEDDLSKLKNELNSYYLDKDWESEIDYIINNFFSKEKEFGIDFDYIKEIASNYSNYKKIVEDKVDEYRKTFEYKDMDLVDRVIFLLGYVENSLKLSPKNVIINEMIELAKKYGDESSYRLIHAIGAKLID